MTRPGSGGAASAQVEAQAKVNLRLRILAREAGGYHQLETLFLRLALADTVRVHRAATRSLDVSGMPAGTTLGPVEQNLAWRAADAYARASGWRDGFAIELEKRIPVGGGLGGGSADAGAVLRALDALAAEPLGEPALLRIAGSLGADVPFLTGPHPYVLAWGRGERMLALTPPEPRPVLLALPPFGVNTAQAYGWLAESRETRHGAGEATPALELAMLASWEALVALAVNDFEPVVAERHPAIADLVASLRNRGCAPTLMSGSGSTVFGVWPDSGTQATRDAELAARKNGWHVTHSADSVEPVRLLD